MRSMLPGAPWLLGHTAMLTVDQPRKIGLLGQDYVLWKDRTGTIQALPNACPHMGAMLSEGWCESDRIVCPFHALAFDIEGCTFLPGSLKKTRSQLQPLELIRQDDFIWSYGGAEPKMPIPTILNDIANEYAFIGHVADMSIKTDLMTILLNMHDYNHQNGAHKALFEIETVNFEVFHDEGFRSHAYYNMPRKAPSLKDIMSNPAVLIMPKVINAHLENIFPSIVIFHSETPIGTVKQIHLFVPESETHTRTYVLMYGRANHPIFNLAQKNILALAKTVVQQDADILGKIYPNSPQKIKLNNEIGMDWVRRNFEHFPTLPEPILSRPALPS